LEIYYTRTNLMKPGFKSALEKYTQQATGSASVCVRQFSSTKDPLSVGAATDPKNSADLRSQADGSAVHTSTL